MDQKKEGNLPVSTIGYGISFISFTYRLNAVFKSDMSG